MKIAVWHNLPSGGGARALNNHLQGLLQRGHKLEIWSQNPTADGFIQLPAEVKIHTVPAQHGKHVAIADRLGAFFFQPDANLRAMEAHAKTCAEQINAGGFDVLFANSCAYYAVPFIGRFSKIPVAIYLGEPYRAFYESQPYSFWQAPALGKVQWLSRSYWKAFFRDLWKVRLGRVQLREERTNIDAIDTLLLNSIFSTESCARAYNRAGEVCYLGIDTQLFKPVTPPNHAPYVIGLGNLFFHKNPALAIEALGKIPKAIRPALVWVSNMKNELFYEQMLQLAAKREVVFEVKEMITDEELVQWLSGAICMTYTSKLEPFGLAPLEANACGTPAIAIAQGGVRETIIDGKTGFLCSEDAAEFAEKIQYLVENPMQLAAMRQAAIENVATHWTLEAATQRLESALLKTSKKSK